MCGYLSGEIFIFLFFFLLLMGKRMGNETKFQRFFLIFFRVSAIFLGNFCSESGIT